MPVYLLGTGFVVNLVYLTFGSTGATSGYRNSWESGLSMQAGTTGATSGTSWCYPWVPELLGIRYIYAGLGYWCYLCLWVPEFLGIWCAGWGYWCYLWDYLVLPLGTGIPGNLE